MQLAAGRGDYLLLLDADMTVTVDHAGLQDLSGILEYLLRHAGSVEYRVRRLVKGDRGGGITGSTHEYLTTEGPEVVERLDAIVIHHYADSGTRPRSSIAIRRLLEKDLRDDPNDLCAVFYLAHTYRDLGRRAEAIELYESAGRHGRMGPRDVLRNVSGRVLKGRERRLAGRYGHPNCGMEVSSVGVLSRRTSSDAAPRTR